MTDFKVMLGVKMGNKYHKTPSFANNVPNQVVGCNVQPLNLANLAKISSARGERVNDLDWTWGGAHTTYNFED